MHYSHSLCLQSHYSVFHMTNAMFFPYLIKLALSFTVHVDLFVSFDLFSSPTYTRLSRWVIFASASDAMSYIRGAIEAFNCAAIWSKITYSE